MCGLAGIINISGIRISDLIEMSRLQKHRGPDDEGYVLVDNNFRSTFFRGNDTIDQLSALPHISSGHSISATFGCAHRRLSIIDLSPAGHQPMASDDQRFFIIYNGEIYNYREIRNELIAKGYSFKSNSDTEVILLSYIEWGEYCVEKFLGMWAIVIWDKLNKSIFLSRDRFGIKPLYYTKLKNTFAFSSEIKALLVLGPAHRQVSRKMIYQYLVFGKLNESYMTLFSNIMELPSGCNLVYHINEHDYRITEYYDLSAHVTNNEIHINSAPISQYNSIFEHSLDLHLRADVPVGSCLSGGLDSSAIVAYSALKLSNNSLNTFTASYRDNQIDESRYARLVSSHYTNIKSHFTYPSSTIFWQDIDKLIWHQDLPIGSTSIFAQWEVMKLASGHKMKVLLDGQGADESLGGYSIFVGILLLSLLKRGKISPFIRNVYNLNKNQNTSILNNIGRSAFFLIPAVFQRKLQNRYRISSKFISSHINKELQIDKNIPRISKTLNIKDTCLQMIKSGLHELLRYEDRNSMAFSIESRLPFLDHRLVEYTMSLEDKWKINNGWSKYILRKISEPILPKEVVWRKDKKGFITPQQNWKQELANDILNYLQNFPFPDILNKNNILDYCKKDISQPSHLSEFWRMFSFLKWIEVNNIKF